MSALKRSMLIGSAAVILLGTLFHFVYDWSGNRMLIGLFFPVNESTWEHMKLAFFPMLICSIFLNRQLRTQYPCISASLYAGILLSTLLIPILFYTYTGILGDHIAVLDIGTFVVSILISFAAVYHWTQSCRFPSYTTLLQAATVILFLLFLFFTYSPPGLGLFADPLLSIP